MKCLRSLLMFVLLSAIMLSCSDSEKRIVLKESKVTLNGQTIEELIGGSGIKDGDFNTDITYDNFPYVPTTGVVQVVRVCLGYKMTYKQMRDYLDRKGLQGANIGQLLAYRPQHLESWPVRLMTLNSGLVKGADLPGCPYLTNSRLWEELSLSQCGDNNVIFGYDCVLAVPK